MSVGKSERAQPRWVTAWFILDAVLTLAPPLYWAFDGGSEPILGVPGAILYFLAVAMFTTLSIVAAYMAEARSGEIG